MGVVQELEESRAEAIRVRAYADVMGRFALGQISIFEAIRELRKRYREAWTKHEKRFFEQHSIKNKEPKS
jgi:hypothetical protein